MKVGMTVRCLRCLNVITMIVEQPPIGSGVQDLLEVRHCNRCGATITGVVRDPIPALVLSEIIVEE